MSSELDVKGGDSDIYNGRPLHILRPSDDRKSFVVVPENLERIAAIQEPITVLSIIGSQRGGKSTLMNLLHSRKTSGFSVGHYMDPQTTGIWVRVRHHPRVPGVTVLLLDTEGLDSPHVRQDYNWILSAFVLLISNAFVYQTKGSIDAHAIERLGVILRVAEQLRGRQSTSKDYCPTFMWLLRDHHLTMSQNTPKDEMLDKLDAHSIKALQRFFLQWDCYPLPRPVDNDADLAIIDQKQYSELSDRFKEDYVMFERLMFDQCSKPTMISGQKMDGSLLTNLIVKYAEAVVKKAGFLTELSELPTQQQMILQLAGERAVKTATKMYQDRIEPVFGKLPVSDQQLFQVHLEAQNEAFVYFTEEVTLGGSSNDDMEPYRKELEKRIASFQDTFYSRYFMGPVVEGKETDELPVSQSKEYIHQCLVEKRVIDGLYHRLWATNTRRSLAECKKRLNDLDQNLIKRRVAATIKEDDEEKDREDAFANVSDFFDAEDQVQVQFIRSMDSVSTNMKMSCLHDWSKEVVRNRLLVAMTCLRRERDAALSAQASDFSSKLNNLTLKFEQQMESAEKAISQLAEENIGLRAKLAEEVLGLRQEAKAQESIREAREDEIIQSLAETKQQLSTEIATSAQEVRQQLTEQVASLRKEAQDEQTSRIARETEILATLQKKAQALSDELKQSTEETRKQLNEAATNLKENVQELKAEREAREAEIVKSIEDTNNKMNTQIKDIEQDVHKLRLSSEAGDFELENSLNQHVENLSTGIKNVEREMTDLINGQVSELKHLSKKEQTIRIAREDDIISSLDTTKTELSSQIDSVSDSLQSQLDDQVNSLKEDAKQFQSIRENRESEIVAQIEKTRQELATQLEQYAEKSRTQVASQVSMLKQEAKEQETIRETKEAEITQSVQTARSELSNEIKHASEQVRHNLAQQILELKRELETETTARQAGDSNAEECLGKTREEIAGQLEAAVHDINTKLADNSNQTHKTVEDAVKQMNLDLKNMEGWLSEKCTNLQNMTERNHTTREEQIRTVNASIERSREAQETRFKEIQAVMEKNREHSEKRASDIVALVDKNRDARDSLLEKTRETNQANLRELNTSIENIKSLHEQSLKQFSDKIQSQSEQYEIKLADQQTLIQQYQSSSEDQIERQNATNHTITENLKQVQSGIAANTSQTQERFEALDAENKKKFDQTSEALKTVHDMIQSMTEKFDSYDAENKEKFGQTSTAVEQVQSLINSLKDIQRDNHQELETKLNNCITQVDQNKEETKETRSSIQRLEDRAEANIARSVAECKTALELRMDALNQLLDANWTTAKERLAELSDIVSRSQETASEKYSKLKEDTQTQLSQQLAANSKQLTEEIKNLQDQVVMCQKQLDGSINEQQQWKSQIGTAHTGFENKLHGLEQSLSETNTNQNKGQRDLVEQIALHTKQLTELRDQIEEEQRSATEIAAGVQAIMEKADSLAEQTQSQADTIQANKQRFDQVTTSLVEAKQTSADIISTINQNKNLVVALQEQISVVTELQGYVDGQSQELQSMRAIIKEEQKSATEIAAGVQAIMEKTDSLSKESQSQAEAVEANKQRFDELTASIEDTKRAVSSVPELKALLNGHSHEFETIRATIKEAQDLSERLDAQLEALNQDINERLQTQNDAHQKSLENFSASLQQLDQKLSDSTSAQNAGQTALSSVQTQLSDVVELTKNVKDNSEELQRINDVILEEQKSAQEIAAGIQAIMEKTDDLNHQVQSNTEAHQANKQVIDQVSQSLNQANQQISDITTHASDESSKFDELSSALKQSIDSLQVLQANQDLSTNKLDDIKEEYERLSLILDQNKKELEEDISLLAVETDKLKVQTVRVDDLKLREKQLRENVMDSVQSEIEQLQSKLAQTAEDQSSSSEKNGVLREEYHELATNFGQFRSYIDKLAKVLKSTCAKMKSFEQVRIAFQQQQSQVKHLEQSCQASFELIAQLSARQQGIPPQAQNLAPNPMEANPHP